jgi:hypothetical protein
MNICAKSLRGAIAVALFTLLMFSIPPVRPY